MKIKLPKGTTGFFNERNDWVCTGSMMGRRNTLPSDLPGGDATPRPLLHLMRLRIDKGGYDAGGAYWGTPSNMWIATEGAAPYSPVTGTRELIPCGVTIYTRADYRWQAKLHVTRLVPGARFYR